MQNPKTNFWKKLPKPFFALAPMADVTDAAFRREIVKYGKPDVMWTEFVSADGLISPGRKVLEMDLRYVEGERPIIAQLFSGKPETMYEAAKIVESLGFDGLDINMGCPDKSIEKQGAGASLMKDVERAKKIIKAAQAGAPSLPISVKTRIGYNKNEIETWIPAILETGISALTIHARTRKEMSLVPARWEHVHEVVALRDKMGLDTLIIGNGDVRDIVQGRKLAEESGADGVMMGRGVFGNPWLFSGHTPTLKEKFEVLIEHTKLFEELMTGVKSFALMKKHYRCYVEGFNGAKDLRVKLMEADTADEVEKIARNFMDENPVLF